MLHFPLTVVLLALCTFNSEATQFRNGNDAGPGPLPQLLDGARHRLACFGNAGCPGCAVKRWLGGVADDSLSQSRELFDVCNSKYANMGR